VAADTRQLIEVLIALSPWVAFIVALVWSWLASARSDEKDERAPRPPDRGARRI
jgi:hypothetical protein